MDTFRQCARMLSDEGLKDAARLLRSGAKAHEAVVKALKNLCDAWDPQDGRRQGNVTKATKEARSALEQAKGHAR